MDSKRPSRRRFLKDGAVLAGLVVGAVNSAKSQAPSPETPKPRRKNLPGFRPYGERSGFETSARKLDPEIDEFWMTPLQDLEGIITPAAVHFQNTHGTIPDIDPRQHRLLIHGMVEHSLILTMEELKRLPSVSRIHFVECAGNAQRTSWKDVKTVQDAYGRASCSEWTGVPLSLVLKEAGVQKGASWLLADGADEGRWMDCFPLGNGMDDDALLVWAQNGEALRIEQGYPLRLLRPGNFGGTNVKWLRQIKVVDRQYVYMYDNMAYYWRLLEDEAGGKVTQAQSFERKQPVRSVITFPSGGQRLPGPGYCQITGLAWSGHAAIRRVEVSTDGGGSWKDAQLQEPVLPKAFTRFRLDWNWNGGEVILQSRSTDAAGNIQPSLAEMSKIHAVSLDFWKTNRGRPPFNPIHRWGIARDGSVYNAMA